MSVGDGSETMAVTKAKANNNPEGSLFEIILNTING